MIRTKYNQRGMTAIMFAMVFSVILTMIAIGFAFLVRNDQRQTLDRYLSYQAQYAAESGVNQAVAEIRANPAHSEQADCVPYVFSEGVQATCVTWTSEAEDGIYTDSLGSEPFITKVIPASNYSELIITWYLSGAGTYAAATGLPNPIEVDNYPVIRFSIMAKAGASYDTSTFRQVYIVPTGSGPGSGSINSLVDGSVLSAECDTEKCTYKFTGVNSGGAPYQTESVVAVSAIGKAADSLRISAESGSNKVALREAQITIDSNAVAQDVTKRVEARIPYNSKETWNPGFAAAAKSICKDIKIDGTNNLAASDGTTDACPLYSSTP